MSMSVCHCLSVDVCLGVADRGGVKVRSEADDQAVDVSVKAK